MTRDVLLDAGPIIAYLHTRDQWHASCAPLWPTLIERLVTTEAVLTEACYLALRAGSAALPLEFLLDAEVPILGLDRERHTLAARLMRRYADLPMDYADASLVALADALAISRAFTTDRRGFGTYRGARGRAFDLLP